MQYIYSKSSLFLEHVLVCIEYVILYIKVLQINLSELLYI
jgi:hypothetical protein